MNLAISGFYASLLAILYLYLSALVIKNRRSKRISLGDGDDKHFLQYLRAHGNFSEYVPLAIILLLIAEVNGVDSRLLHFCGASLLFGRLFHSVGLVRHVGVSWQRIGGMVLTFLAIFLLAVLNLWMLF